MWGPKGWGTRRWTGFPPSFNGPASLNPKAWFEPRLSTKGETLPDLITGALATLGSTGGADTNDPRWLVPVAGRKYLYNPAITNGAKYSANATAFASGDRTCRLYIEPDTWGNPNNWLAGTTVSGELFTVRGWTDTSFNVYWKDSVGTTQNKVVTVPSLSATANGAPMWVELALDVDNGNVEHVVTCRFSTDGVNWTNEGSTITAGVTTCVPTSSVGVHLGGTGGWFAVTKILEGQHIAGFQGGTVEANFDARELTPTATSYVDTVGTLGGTWTIERNTSGRKSVLIDKAGLMLFGTDDHLQLPDSVLPAYSATDKATFVMVYRGWPNTVSGSRLFSNRVDATTVGLTVYNLLSPEKIRFFLQDGSTTFVAATPDVTRDGKLEALQAGRRLNTGFIQWNETAESTIDLSTAAVGDLGGTGYNVAADAVPGSWNNIEFMAFLIFERILTDKEWTDLLNYYQGVYQ